MHRNSNHVSLPAAIIIRVSFINQVELNRAMTCVAKQQHKTEAVNFVSVRQTKRPHKSCLIA